MNPLVSIIVPIYNSARFLIETLQSIQDQTYDNLQILLVDDASTDASPDIIQGFIAGDERFHCFTNNCNRGVSFSTNVGLAYATGNFITFHDHDDLMYSSKIAICVDLLEKGAGFEGVLTTAVYISENGEPLGSTTSLPDYLTANPYFVRAFERSYITTWSIFLRRDALYGVQFDDEIRIGNQDADFFLRLLYHRPRFIYFADPLTKFRQVSGSLSKSSCSTTDVEIYRKHQDADISRLYTAAGYDDHTTCFALAKISLWRDDPAGALLYSRRAYNQLDRFSDTERDDLCFLHATCLYLNELFAPCLELLRQIEVARYRSEVFNNQGVCWMHLGNSVAARHSFERSLSYLPTYMDASTNLERSAVTAPGQSFKFTQFPIRCNCRL